MKMLLCNTRISLQEGHKAMGLVAIDSLGDAALNELIFKPKQ